MSEVLLALKRDAKTDPPENQRGVMTDLGAAWYAINGRWYGHMPFHSIPLDPQPVWWCDPQPPGEDTLTVEDMRRALYCLEDWLTAPLTHGELPRSDLGTSARLRAALDALTRKDTP